MYDIYMYMYSYTNVLCVTYLFDSETPPRQTAITQRLC